MWILSFLVLLSPVIIEAHVDYCKQDDLEEWSYHGKTNGPAAWGETFPNCYGKSQSPIAILSRKSVKTNSLEKLSMENYDKPVTRARVVNNGHTVQIVPQDGVDRYIDANDKHFSLQQLHFHWGSNWDRGSEHTLDGKQYALEAHFVHRSDDGQLAVVGVFFQEVRTNNRAFDPICEVLPDVKFNNDSTNLKRSLNLEGLLPNNPASFYRYSGSLTTPPCDENVVWSVLEGVQKLGSSQLQKLRSLYSARRDQNYKGCQLKDNYRPVQPLNGRPVYKNA